MARTRNGTGHGRLLLLAALLLGIVTMHTLGHPSGGHGSEAAPTAAHHAAADMPAPHGRDAGPHRPGGEGPERDVAHERDVEAGRGVEAGHGAGGGMVMDPLSVCLAVLGAFTLLLLVRAGLLRPGGTVVHTYAPGRRLHGLRPDPPPPRILLSHLSVLRI
ncbi:hypothetical protein [Streptomyces venezuelae]|uniref:hypothetical protein n=1 Tax=Streptomyces venezuelae TaxID=54571 RepID=UPI00365114D8